MTQEKPTALLGRCTTIINKDIHNEGYMRNQTANKPTDARTCKQQETLVHVISMLNVTWHANQVNRQKLNEVMNALQKANEHVNTLFNITDVLTKHLRYQEINTYANTIAAYIRDSLMYMWQVAIHTMDYIDAAMTNMLSPNILPVEELRNMLRHTESQLLSKIQLPIS